jgi:gluconolactonase
MRTFLAFLLLILTGAAAQDPEQGSVVRLDPALDDILAPNSKLEPLADVPGRFTREGPVWIRDGGYLIYTVRNGNRHAGSPPPTDADVIKWDPRNGEVSVLVKGLKADGITVDRSGRIVAALNIGEGQITRLEKTGERTVLANQYQGTPINPNDLVYRSDGVLYFTSPPRYGSTSDIPSLFMLKNGELELLSPTVNANIERPNGLAFSPDEKYLYATNTPLVMKFEVMGDNTIANGRIFVDMSDHEPLTVFPDGIKVDTEGNVYVTGPGGVWIIAPDGKHLGTIIESHHPASLAFGDKDGKTLFITSRPGLYRIPLKVPGLLP